MPFLEESFPQLVPLYKKRYSGRAFLPPEYRRRITALVRKLCEKYAIGKRGPGKERAFVVTQRGAAQLRLFA
jgi:hypothetical protein